MNRIIIILIFLVVLPGCASTGDLLERNVSPAQTYRPKGSDEAVTISGQLDRTYASLGKEYKHLQVSFNGVLAIDGFLGDGFFGDITGTWLEKPVSASCTGRQASDTWVDVRCIVFIENERTVTLTF